MGLRERLRERGLPQTTHPLLVAQLSVLAAAQAELEEAVRALALARTAPQGHLLVERYEAERDTARTRVEGCYEDVRVRALPPADLEVLIGEHPPTPEQEAKGHAWNPDSFVPALLAACVESDEVWTEADWAEMTSKGVLALGEVNALFEAAQVVNGRSPDLRLGKGWSPTRS